MKAILRSHQGYTRDVAIVPPPPEYITMAVSESGSQIWNPDDLMVGEKMIFKSVKFKKHQALPKEDAWLYVQEGPPPDTLLKKTATADDFYNSIKSKLEIQIAEQITQAGPFYNMMKKKATEGLHPLLVSWLFGKSNMKDDEILAICEKHKKDHGYDSYIEEQMATLGYKTPPIEGEDPVAYLTRLLLLVTNNNKLKIAYDQQKQAQKIQQKYYEGLQNKQYNPLYQEWPSEGIQKYTTQVPNHPLLGDPIDSPLTVPPKIEPETRPKPKLPEPIEPRKRLMKKVE